MNNPDYISESLETIFWVKRHKFFDADPGWKRFESGIRDKQSRIRNTALTFSLSIFLSSPFFHSSSLCLRMFSSLHNTLALFALFLLFSPPPTPVSLCFLKPCPSLALSHVSSWSPLLFSFLFIFLLQNEEAAAVGAPADVNGQGDQRDEEEDDGGDAMPVPQVGKSVFRIRIH